MRFGLFIFIASINCLPTGLWAQPIKTVYSFDSISGGHPNVLAQGRNGMLYGTTQVGGTLGAGTIFALSPSGTLGVISEQLSGVESRSGLALGSDGNLYGEDSTGGIISTHCPSLSQAQSGCGTLFRVTRAERSPRCTNSPDQMGTTQTAG